MPAIWVVGCPGLVRSLEKDVGMTRVISNHPEHLAGSSRIRAHQIRKVYARYGARRDLPRSGHGPIATVHKPGRRVCQARGLGLRLRNGRSNGSEFPGACSVIEPHPIDIKMIVAGACLDFKGDRLADIKAYVSCKSLDTRVVASRIPTSGSGLCVLTNDGIDALRNADLSGKANENRCEPSGARENTTNPRQENAERTIHKIIPQSSPRWHFPGHCGAVLPSQDRKPKKLDLLQLCDPLPDLYPTTAFETRDSRWWKVEC